MVPRFPFAFFLLISLLLAACAPQNPVVGTPSPAATAPLVPTWTFTGAPALTKIPVPSEDPASTPDPRVASGEFLVRNTSQDMPEVLVETMQMVFEYQQEQTVPWQALAAACTFTPTAPILVRETQTVQYNCRLEEAPPPGAALRAAVEIRLLGSDQVFRMEVSGP